MRHKIKQTTKRVLAYLLVGCIVSSAAFFSYSNTMTVKAVDNGDLAEDVVYTILATIGVVGATVASGGTLTVPMLMPFLYQIAGDGFDVYNYITDNGDGTVTVSDDLTQMVIQAYQLYKEENAALFDGTMEKTADGYYDFGDVTVSSYFPSSDSLNTTQIKGIKTNYPCALLVLENASSDGKHSFNGMAVVYYSETTGLLYTGYCNQLKEIYSEYSSYFASETNVGPHYCGHLCTIYVDRNGQSSSSNSYFVGANIVSGGLIPDISVTVSSSSIPVYKDNIPALYEGLRTGDFSGAYNYGTMPDCESSKYTGSYSGGDITVKTEKLDGIQEKLDEINQTDKNIDDKLQELLDWLNGEESGGSSGGFSGWLEKIYAKLQDIEKILKKLKNWTIADTIADVADAIADWGSLIHDLLADADSGAESVVSALSSTLDQSLLRTKFPFSIPWDLLLVVSAFSAEPEAPCFEIPFSFPSLGVDYTLVIDLNSFGTLSKICRSLMSIIYAVGLLKATPDILGIGGDST